MRNSAKHQQALVDLWNQRHPPGTLVIYHKLINPLEYPKETKTRSKAWLMGGHSAMVMVEGVAGGVMIESLLLTKGEKS
jgi:hypothetical protein